MSRTLTSRTLNGSGASDPSSLFVAATVRLLLPLAALRRITDAMSLRWTRHIQIAAVPFPEAKIRGCGWLSGDRSAGSGLNESGFYSLIAIRDGCETGTDRRCQSVGRKVFVTHIRPGLRVSGDPGAPGIPAGVPAWRDERSPALGGPDRGGPVSD